MLRGGTLEEGKSQCFLGFCLTLWSLIHLTDVCGLDTIHTISCYFTTLFPHLSAICVLPSYPTLVAQILLHHLFLPTKQACLDCCSFKIQTHLFSNCPRQTPSIDLGSLQQCMAGENGCKFKGQSKRKENTFISRTVMSW